MQMRREDSLWRESMCFGVKLIDEQRADLACLIEEVNNRPEDTINSEYFLGKFSVLQVVLSEYFAREESWMEQLALPVEQKTAHCDEHSRILGLFNDIYFDSMNHKHCSAHDIYLLVREEISKHMLGADATLQSRG